MSKYDMNRAVIYNNVYSSYDQNQFIFPFERVPKDSKVALYGAGKVGSEYYKQLLTTGYCDCVVWVDLNWENYKEEIKEVRSLSFLLSVEYDYVIIAIQNIYIVKNVIDNLIKLGVDYRKIVFRDPRLLSINNLDVKKNAISKIKKWGKKDRKIILMNTPDHGNIGDQAIAEATNLFLNDNFQNHILIEFTGFQWEYSKYEICNFVNGSDLLLITGGGYMGDMWENESERVKEIIKFFPKNRIIFMPHTFYYKDRSKLKQDLDFFNNYDNLLLIHREKNSYELFESINSSNNKNLLYPDMVFYYDNSEIINTNGDKVGICLRQDKEKNYKEEFEGKIFRIVNELKIPYELFTTDFDEKISETERKKRIIVTLRNIASYGLIITDRLHAMIFAFLTGTPCIAIDNSTHKVRGSYKWIHKANYIECIDESKLTADIVEKLYTMKNVMVSDFSLRLEFLSMAYDIKRWIFDSEQKE